MYIIFQQNHVSRISQNRAHKIICKNMSSCINLQLRIIIVILKITTISDIHDRITYMYINFQQIWVSRSVKTLRTNRFVNLSDLRFFKTTNSNFEKKYYFRHASSYNVLVYQFPAKSGY